jgi:hypothetical protein
MSCSSSTSSCAVIVRSTWSTLHAKAGTTTELAIPHTTCTDVAAQSCPVTAACSTAHTRPFPLQSAWEVTHSHNHTAQRVCAAPATLVNTQACQSWTQSTRHGMSEHSRCLCGVIKLTQHATSSAQQQDPPPRPMLITYRTLPIYLCSFDTQSCSQLTQICTLAEHAKQPQLRAMQEA